MASRRPSHGELGGGLLLPGPIPGTLGATNYFENDIRIYVGNGAVRVGPPSPVSGFRRRVGLVSPTSYRDLSGRGWGSGCRRPRPGGRWAWPCRDRRGPRV